MYHVLYVCLFLVQIDISQLVHSLASGVQCREQSYHTSSYQCIYTRPPSEDQHNLLANKLQNQTETLFFKAEDMETILNNHFKFCLMTTITILSVIDNGFNFFEVKLVNLMAKQPRKRCHPLRYSPPPLPVRCPKRSSANQKYNDEGDVLADGEKI